MHAQWNLKKGQCFELTRYLPSCFYDRKGNGLGQLSIILKSYVAAGSAYFLNEQSDTHIFLLFSHVFFRNYARCRFFMHFKEAEEQCICLQNSPFTKDIALKRIALCTQGKDSRRKLKGVGHFLRQREEAPGSIHGLCINLCYIL